MNYISKVLSLIKHTGGRLLNNQTIVDKALQLNDACWNTYASTAYVLPILHVGL